MDQGERAALDYARLLTKSPATETDILKLKDNGFDDGEILEVNQVVSYFNYVNRSVMGLGVTTAGDILGLSPSISGDPDSWKHQ